MAGPVRIAILADGSRARREFATTSRSIDTLGARASKAGKFMAKGLAIGAIAGAAGLVRFGVDSVQALARIEKINAQTAAALKSTGNTANVSAKGVENLAGRLEKVTATEAEAIQEGANLLLTFTNISNQAGKGNRIFDRTVSVMTDMGRALGADAKGSAVQLGKALNDPIKGISALSRVGVSFTEQQKATIKTLVDTGDTMGAQKVILRELTKEFGGSGRAFAATTEGKIELAKNALGDFGEAITARVLPAVGELADKGTKALEELTKRAPEIEATATDLFDMGKTIADSVIPPLKTLFGVAKDGVEFFNGLPGPVKEFAVQAGIAAVVLPRLSAGITSVTASARASATALGTAATRTKMLGTAARGAAGLAGVGLLSASTQESNRALSTLEGVAGSAALGFSVGGPWGAAVGAVGGVTQALIGVVDRTYDAKDASILLSGSYDGVNTKAADYRSTLDELTGAITRQTKAAIIQRAQDEGVLALANRLNVNSRDLIGTILGQEGATRRLARATREHSASLEGPEQAQWNTWITRNARDFAQQANASDEARAAMTSWKRALKGVPKDVRTRVMQIGADISARQVRNLKKQYNLTPAQVRTIVRAVGTETTIRKIDGVYQVIKDGDRIRPNLSNWIGSYASAIADNKRQARRGTQDLTSLLSGGTRGAKADTKNYQQSISSGVGRARGIAASESPSVGAALGSGVVVGFNPYISILAYQASTAVRNAIAAARAAAKIKSPSRKMYEVGDLMGQGLVNGLAARRTGAKAGGRDLVRSLLEGVTDGTAGVDKALGKISALIEKRIKGKDEAKRERAALKALKGQYEQLRKNGREQDKNTRRIEAATSKTKSLVQAARQYAATIKQGFVDYGNVVGLGVREGSSSVSLTGLLSQLEARAAASVRFAALIRQLRADGANRTTIQQLLDAGAEGGLATAEAIASGGRSAITQINSLTSQIASTGSKLGESMRKAYKQAGTQAAQGLVDGLKKRQRELDKVAERIASSLVKAVKKALGIKSPSRVFRTIGDQTLKGLELGLDETYVRRMGTRSATALRQGFGTPALDAYARNSTAGAAQPVTVQVRLSADQVSQMARGKEYVADIDVFFKNGGTTQTIVKKGTLS